MEFKQGEPLRVRVGGLPVLLIGKFEKFEIRGNSTFIHLADVVEQTIDPRTQKWILRECGDRREYKGSSTEMPYHGAYSLSVEELATYTAKLNSKVPQPYN